MQLCRNLLYLIARCLGTFSKLFSQHIAVRPSTETGGNNYYLFHWFVGFSLHSDYATPLYVFAFYRQALKMSRMSCS